VATISEPARQSFHLSQLIYDTRYRSITIQVLALIGLVALLWWMGRNAVANLATLGKDISFDFMWTRANYDINQTLIAYDSSMTHGRAALVGILNTLLVAVLGCITATIFGIFAGVLRLSKNWLISRLMAVYVEGFRNVPLVLWIVFIYAMLTESTPGPREFAEGGTASKILFGTVAITNRGAYLPAPVWGDGAGALGIVFLVSLIAIFVVRRWSRARQEQTGQTFPMFWAGLGLLILPSLLAYLVLGRPVAFTLPELGGFNFQGGIQVSNALLALWLALSLYTGAFIAEIVRAGIMAISKGQSEAAFALGLRPNRTMNLVILPQALRVIIPPLISQFLNLTKNSSLALAIGYMDVRATLGGVTLFQTGRELEAMLLLGAFYLATSLFISFVMNLYNRSVALKER
jgi:general L-amino acid transport system permease protein